MSNEGRYIITTLLEKLLTLFDSEFNILSHDLHHPLESNPVVSRKKSKIFFFGIWNQKMIPHFFIWVS